MKRDPDPNAIMVKGSQSHKNTKKQGSKNPAYLLSAYLLSAYLLCAFVAWLEPKQTLKNPRRNRMIGFQ